MQIKSIKLQRYQTTFINDQLRFGIFIELMDTLGNSGWGEIAPLPKWSQETLEEAIWQLQQKNEEIKNVNWEMSTLFHELLLLKLFPSVLFGLESALLSLLNPFKACWISTSTLLMGSKDKILRMAQLKHNQGFVSAKIKVNQLSFSDAFEVINQLKDKFYLRIDVNKAWKTEESLKFFSQFALDAFDYVEEPFENALDLFQFTHPLAIDESYPNDLTLNQLENLLTLKAIIYKPTIQGGMTNCLGLEKWASSRNIALVLSSSFESDIGLGYVALLSQRLSLKSPVGIGTFSYLTNSFAKNSLVFKNSEVWIPEKIEPTFSKKDF
jgi:O-succinylbenzoate synthase